MDWNAILSQSLQQGLGPVAAVYCLAAIGLNVHFGYTGLLNFGQAGFMAVGGYAVASFVATWGLSFWLGSLVGLACAGLLALILGIPTLRLRADYLAIVTIAAAEIIRQTIGSVTLLEYFGGQDGLQGFNKSFASLNPFTGRVGIPGVVTWRPYDYWTLLVCWIMVALCCLIVWALMRSPWGRVLKGIREDEDAVRSLGKNVYAYKMQSLMIGGLIGGLAGIMSALQHSAINPSFFATDTTFFAYTVLLVGGAARVLGPVAGTIIFWFLISFLDLFFGAATSGTDPLIPEAIMNSNQASLMRFIFLGLALMLLMIFRPQGIFGDRRDWLSMPTEMDDVDEVEQVIDVDTSGNRAALKDAVHEPGSAKSDPILVVDGIRRTFGGLTAVDVEHVEIQRGVITGLIGPNGAGKTTFFNLLTGFDQPDEGQWTFNGSKLKGMSAYRVARLGMVRTFQLTKVLSRLTVIENMRVGATGQQGERLLRAMFAPLWRSQETANTERADSLLERFLLIKKREDFAGSLSGGQRKLLEMARALMANPELVMLDEPMAGVNPALKQSLLGHVKSLRDEGRTVLFVEHDMDMVRDISDWVIVMAQGKVIAEGPPDAVMGDQRVIDAYLGSHHDQDLSNDEVEEQILAEAQAEIEEGPADERPGTATEGEHRA